MANRSDLAAQAAECTSLDDFIGLADAALADPADLDYAKECIQKAELQCQMPLDYIKTADIVVLGLNDIDYAKELYEQAEDMLFESVEFIAYAESVCKNLGDEDKAREYLEKAADEASEPSELLAMSNLAQQELDDEELGASLLARVEEKVTSLDGYLALAKSLQDGGDEQASKAFFKKAARFCDDVSATVNYAGQIKDIYADTAWVKQSLDDAEMDCQFTKDFVALASGYKNLLGDEDKMQELMEQAEEFCMTGEELVDLGEGFLRLLQDKEKAAQSYAKALVDITDKDALLDLAKKSVTELENIELAKKIYRKTEERMSSVTEFNKLAQAVINNLQDKNYAGEIYLRAKESSIAPNDLINLGRDVISQLGDSTLATSIFRKAFDNANDFKQLLKLVDPIKDKLNDDGFAKEILQKAEQKAENSPDLLKISEIVLSKLGDTALAKNILEAAEEHVTSLGEMRSVVEQVKQHYTEDGDWISRVEEKLRKRETNQAKYNVFQEKEKRASSVLDFTYIADQVMSELEDKFYAKKLLTTAEEIYQETDNDFNQGRLLLLNIDKHLQDEEWTQKLLDDAADKASNFSQLLSVATTASNELTGKAFGQGLAKKYLQSWELRLDSGDAKSAYDYSKLAKVATQNLGDNIWAASLLDKAKAKACDHFSFAELGEIASQIGDEQSSASLLQQAAKACSSPAKAIQLASRLTTRGIAADTVKNLYMGMKKNFQDPDDQLSWASGIVQIFKDQAWASQEYEGLSSAFSNKADAVRFNANKASNLERKFW